MNITFACIRLQDLMIYRYHDVHKYLQLNHNDEKRQWAFKRLAS